MAFTISKLRSRRAVVRRGPERKLIKGAYGKMFNHTKKILLEQNQKDAPNGTIPRYPLLVLTIMLLFLSAGFNLVVYSRTTAAYNRLAARDSSYRELSREFDQLRHKWEDLQKSYDKLLVDKRELENRLDRDPISHGSGNPIAYLTFDDGPGAFTPRLLQILAQCDVKATFFVTSQNLTGDENIYSRILQQGHALGNHSESHDYKKIYRSKGAFLEDLQRLENLLVEKTGVKPDIYRFPGGSSNAWVTPTVLKEIIAALTERGYDYFDWNVATGDSNTNLTGAQIVANLVKQADELPGKDLVILMHTTKPSTVEALPRIIEKLNARGYRFAPLKKGAVNVKHRR